MTDFDRDTTAEPLGAGRYRVRFEPRWHVVRGPNGGYVAAALVNAIRAEVGDPARQLRSLTVHYLSAPKVGEAEVTVTVERSGRSMSSVSVRAEQDGRTIVLALAALASAYPSPIALANATMPDVPAPEELEVPRWEDMEEPRRPPPFAFNFTLIPVVGPGIYTNAHEAYTGGWIRLRQERPLDEALLVAIADSWLPAVFSVVDRPLLAPTIDLTVHLRAPLPRPWDWVFIDVRTNTASEGFIEEDVRLFARDGTLLAQGRQLALALEL